MSGPHAIGVGPREGPAVAWVGSLGSTVRMWDRQVAELQPRCRCVLIDLPGRGASAPSSIAGLAGAVIGELARHPDEVAELVASQDPATPPEHGELIASLVRGAVLELVDAAHLASWERAAPVNALLGDHLFGGEGGG